MEAQGDGSGRETLRPGSRAHPLTPPALHPLSSMFTPSLPEPSASFQTLLMVPPSVSLISLQFIYSILRALRAFCFMAIATLLLHITAPRYTFVLLTKSSQRSARSCSFCVPSGAYPHIMVASTLYHELAVQPPYVLSLSEPHTCNFCKKHQTRPSLRCSRAVEFHGSVYERRRRLESELVSPISHVALCP